MKLAMKLAIKIGDHNEVARTPFEHQKAFYQSWTSPKLTLVNSHPSRNNFVQTFGVFFRTRNESASSMLIR